MIDGWSFYYALLLPINLTLLTTFIPLITVMRSLAKHNQTNITDDQKHGIVQARIALACTSLFVLTWIFGFLMINENGYVFQVLFAVFNSLQGIFTFIFYVLFDKDVKKEWKDVCVNIKNNFDRNNNKYDL